VAGFREIRACDKSRSNGDGNRPQQRLVEARKGAGKDSESENASSLCGSVVAASHAPSVFFAALISGSHSQRWFYEVMTKGETREERDLGNDRGGS